MGGKWLVKMLGYKGDVFQRVRSSASGLSTLTAVTEGTDQC